MSRSFRRVHRVKAFAKSNANRVRLVCWLVFEQVYNEPLSLINTFVPALPYFDVPSEFLRGIDVDTSRIDGPGIFKPKSPHTIFC